MGDTFSRYIEKNPDEFEDLKQQIEIWLEENEGTPYPKVSVIAQEVTDAKSTRGGFKTPLVRLAVNELGFEEYGSSRIRNPYSFDE